MLICCSRNIYYHVWEQLYLLMFVNFSLCWIENIFCNNINLYCSFWSFNASLLNKIINFFPPTKKNRIDPTLLNCIVIVKIIFFVIFKRCSSWLFYVIDKKTSNLDKKYVSCLIRLNDRTRSCIILDMFVLCIGSLHDYGWEWILCESVRFAGRDGCKPLLHPLLQSERNPRFCPQHANQHSHWQVSNTCYSNCKR